MTRSPRWPAVLATTLVGLLTVFAGSSPALAASGSGYIYHAPGTSYGYYSYNNVNTVLTTMRVLSNPATLASGKCLDIWLDHHNSTGGHYDSRVARSCRTLTQRDSGSTAEPGALNGLNRLGVCYGNNNATNSPISNCAQTIGSLSGVPVSLPNKCSRSWIVSSGVTVTYNSGGNVYSCTS
jgi:hypothetical protein